MSTPLEVTVFNLGGKDTIHTYFDLEDARRYWQKHLDSNELMPIIDRREPSWQIFLNPNQVKSIQRVTVA